MRQLVVHSALYYTFDESLVPDSTFDRWSVELLGLIKEHPEIASKHPFWFYFKDWDGSTGYHLASLPWGMEKALQLLRDHSRRT